MHSAMKIITLGLLNKHFHIFIINILQEDHFKKFLSTPLFFMSQVNSTKSKHCLQILNKLRIIFQNVNTLFRFFLFINL